MKERRHIKKCAKLWAECAVRVYKNKVSVMWKLSFWLSVAD